MHYLFSLLSLLFLAPTPAPVAVDVEVTSTRPARGDVRLAVFATAEDFENDQPIFAAVAPCRKEATKLEVVLPAAGTYAIAVFHDLNGNGKLDRNFFGIPSEPYGFSAVPPSKWEKPAFGDISGKFQDGARAKVALRTWKEY